MLKVKNLGSKFTSITAGVMNTGDIKHLAIWEVKMLNKMKTYDLQLIMDEQ